MSNHASLQRLWIEAKGHCFYCGCETWLPEPGQVQQRMSADRPKRRMATREHLKGKLEGDPLTKGSDLVLACHHCNLERGRQQQRVSGPEILQRRSHPWKYGYVGLRHALAMDPNYLNPGAPDL
jgi:hypothetical protein